VTLKKWWPKSGVSDAMNGRGDSIL
jgi:hypothetical protein